MLHLPPAQGHGIFGIFNPDGNFTFTGTYAAFVGREGNVSLLDISNDNGIQAGNISRSSVCISRIN
jgi:hypothetical protein